MKESVQTTVNESFDFRTIKTFEDACKKLNIDPSKLPDVSSVPEEFAKPIVAGYKLMVIYKAINNGWEPDWSDWGQYKYYPWFEVLSSGVGFSNSNYHFVCTNTSVGSRLCTDTSEKATYAGKQFENIYKDYFLL